MFNPPASPTNGAEFTYGNVTWQYQNPPGVWNIKDGTLVGTDGVGVSGFRIDASNLKFYYVYPDGATSAEINLGTVVGGGVGGGLTFRASNNTTDSVEPGETFTITGAGPTVRTTVSGNTMRVDVRLATKGATGVSRYSDDFTVASDGLVAINSSGIVSHVLRESFGNTDVATLGSTLTITGGAGVFTVGGANDTIAIRGHTATSSQLGVASFNSRDFQVSSGAVSFANNAASVVYRDSKGETGEFTAAPTRATFTITGGANGIYTYLSGDKASLIIAGPTASYANRGSASFNSTHFEVTDGAVSLSGAYASTVTGDTVVAGSGINISRSGNEVTVNANGVAASDFRIGSYTLTGVASFDPRFFGIGSTGHLTLTGPYQVTGDTVTGGASTSAVKVYRSGNVATVDVAVASTSTTGVAYFETANFLVSGGKVTAKSITVSANSGSVSSTLGSNLYITGSAPISTLSSAIGGGEEPANNAIIISAANASYTSKGVASFDPRFFGIGSTGHLTLTGSYGVVGVTGIGFGDDVGLTGKINITAGSNITITQNNNLITINSSASQSGVGLPAGLTAQKDRLVFTNHEANQGLTHSANLLFDGTSLTFGGTNTIITVTGPTMSFHNNTVVRGGMYSDFRERGLAFTLNLTGAQTSAIYIGPTGPTNNRAYFQKIDIINLTGGYWKENPNAPIEIRPSPNNWSNETDAVETIIVMMRQVGSGRLGYFPDIYDGTVMTDNDPTMFGVTGGVDIFMLTRYKIAGDAIYFGQSIAKGMTGFGF